MSIRDLETLILMGYEFAKSTGGAPIVVVPSSLRNLAAPTLIIADDLFDENMKAVLTTNGRAVCAAQQGSWQACTGPILVFCGPMFLLQQQIAAGRFPNTQSALVYETGAWLQSKPNPPVDLPMAHLGRNFLWQSNFFHPNNSDINLKWRADLKARRYQPTIDGRERRLAEELRNNADFPYRMPSVVPGRVVLGIGSLGSGGAERQILNTAHGLAQRGVTDVHLILEHLEESGETAFYIEKARATVASIQTIAADPIPQPQWTARHPEFSNVLGNYMVSRILSAAQLLKQLSPEIVLCSLDWTNITLGMAAALAGVPHILLSGRNLSPIYFDFFQWFMYPCYRALSAHPSVSLLNNSQSGADDYAKWLRLPQDKIKVLRNGLDTTEFQVVGPEMRDAARAMFALDKTAPVIAGAFRLSQEKRPLMWVEAAALIIAAHPAATFLICGIGLEEAATKARAQSLGILDRVRFLGARSDIQMVFAAADVVMQTSLQEGTPNSLIEAQAMGIPVVSTPAFGAAEAINDGVTGIIVRNETADGAARAVLQILGDKAFSEKVKTAGPLFVKQRFGFDRMIDDTMIAFAETGAEWARGLLPSHLRYKTLIDLSGFEHVHGHCYKVNIPSFERYSDSSSQPKASSLVILEGENFLGPAHSVHDAIASIGKGAYSHWSTLLYFSTSDGSDPRTNGRVYKAAIKRP